MRELKETYVQGVYMADILQQDNEDAKLLQYYKNKSSLSKNKYWDGFSEDLLHQGYKSRIFLDPKSNKANLRQTIKEQKHLTTKQQQQLLEALIPFGVLFDGKLGKFKPYEIDIELKANAIPKASRPYLVP